MAWDKGEGALLRWARFSKQQLAAIGDVELAILKMHLMLEDALKFLLAKRLKLQDDAFFDLQLEFAKLVEISTAGVGKTHLVGALRALNAARNHVSHRVESRNVPEKLQTFVEEAGRLQRETISWSPNPEELLQTLQKAFDAVALAIFEVAVSAND